MTYPELHKASAVPAGHSAYQFRARVTDFQSFSNKRIPRIVGNLFFSSHFGCQFRCHIHCGKMRFVFTYWTGNHA